MTPIEKAKWIAEFYNAVAEGKTMQTCDGLKEWTDVPLDDYQDMPTMCHTLTRWRIKPEPRRKWETSSTETYNPLVAAEWRKQGLTVTEWLEVV
jgi:hypothetical protein